MREQFMGPSPENLGVINHQELQIAPDTAMPQPDKSPNGITRTSSSPNELLERVSKTAEVITNPESETLKDFHKFLGHFFKPEEIEPVEVYQRELANQNPDVRYILTVLRDPKKSDELISAAYGSVQSGILAFRFILTDPSYRATGISQEADKLLINEADQFCKQKGMELKAFVGETNDLVESFVNKIEIEPNNARRRLYFGDGREVHYEIPPLAWSEDGTPIQEGVSEHLQVAVKGYPEKVPVPVLESILKDWWNEWYIRPRDQFASDEAWELHKKTVWDILENKILAPMRGVSELKLTLKKERKASGK